MQLFLAVREKGKQPLNSTASKKMKITHLEQVKPPDIQTSEATLTQEKIDTVSEVVQPQLAERSEIDKLQPQEERKENQNGRMMGEEDKESKKMAEEDSRRKAEAVERAKEERQRLEEERKRRQAEIEEKWKEEQKKREMKIAELEGKIRSCR